MKLTPLSLSGAYIVDIEEKVDERGFFARTWCAKEWGEKGLSIEQAQCSISYNKQKGTIRGLHYQEPPYEEIKWVRCFRGRIFDVIVDMRPSSITYLKWEAVELSAQNRRALYIPKGFAHGFQTLEDETEIYYQISEFFHPESSRTLAWNDPKLKIEWPLPVANISSKDNVACFIKHIK
jgi:dTDP-4-dehydrorhamnose 3,5-epimerase